ncbi:putative chitinase [Microsporum ferrugineum]
MDTATPVSLFDDIAALKDIKPSLQIYISIGGWTFSDNNTMTQPVFGNIARSPENREKFANNVLDFLNQYGFDGIDIDWEYPGAPDRGGHKEDTKNYVEMVKTLRKVFDKSGRKLGITFTGPSSFWYMRWFDLPGLLKYADWMNLMSYDLHGVWDQTNPIGSIAQAHTNLTEIKLAAELLWRVEVKPSQVAIGFGFYGRAFTLQDPSCTDPGCPFSAGADPGICTRTSGYLAYYEIQDILSKEKNTKSLLNNGDIKIAHDKTAAVKYFTWNNDQWISYDDADTFKQKIDWANSIGFSGSLIWASDLAHKAITGKTNIESALTIKDSQEQLNPDPDTVSSDLNGSLAKDCYKFRDIVALDNPQVSTCRSGYTTVGYDRATSAGKDGEWGRPWCCPKNSGLKNCQWRGSGGDCNGQCHPGEIHLDGSSWGGKPGESGTGKCSRGGKALCCQMEQFEAFTNGCYWTDGANKPCNDLDMKLAYAWDKSWGGTVFNHGNSYCCPATRPPPYKDCHWVGQGDCADNTCDKTEVTLETDTRGDTYGSCGWGRKKSLCCKPNLDEFTTFTCESGHIDPCDDPSDECEDSGDDDTGNSLTIRSDEDGSPILVRRGGIRSASLLMTKGLSFSKHLIMTSRSHPSGLKLFKGIGAKTLPIPLYGGYR